MITQADFYGGSEYSTPSGDRTLKATSKRVQVVNPSVSVSVILPDARTLSLGGPSFYVLHTAAAGTVTVKDGSGSGLIVLDPGYGCVVALSRGDDAAGDWALRFGVLGKA
jgi:hypothetical protein